MKNLLLLFVLFAFSLAQIHAQDAKPFIEKCDPEARKILKKLSGKYKSDSGIQAEFNLVMENGEYEEVQSGKLSQKGDKFRVILDGNEIICDGETIWMKQENTVQINNYEPEEDTDIISPNKIFRIYEAEEDYFYAITDKNSKTTSIEFKPRDRDSEYMKMRLVVDNDKNEVVSIKIFDKEGGRYTLKIKSFSPKTLSDSYFKFDKSKHPGIDVEDMRI